MQGKNFVYILLLLLLLLLLFGNVVILLRIGIHIFIPICYLQIQIGWTTLDDQSLYVADIDK